MRAPGRDLSISGRLLSTNRCPDSSDDGLHRSPHSPHAREYRKSLCNISALLHIPLRTAQTDPRNGGGSGGGWWSPALRCTNREHPT